MSDADWDADDFESPIPEVKPTATAAAGGDKWDGEDEEDDLKDNWDDEDAEANGEAEGGAVQKKKKKTLAERIAEKEAAKRAAIEERRRIEAEARAKLTPEEIVAEKLRQQKIVEESDLEIAADVFGVAKDALPGNTIDSFSPTVKDDFEKFAELLKTKITLYDESPYYIGFLDTLFRDLSVSLDVDDIKKLGSTLNTLGNEKQKQAKSTGKKGKKSKAKLTSGRENAYDDYQQGGLDQFDDFM